MMKANPGFVDYFGHLFEAYIGIVLKNWLAGGTLLSEGDIRRTYPATAGKCPDWVLIDGCTAILFECKATHFSRITLATGDEGELQSDLRQIRKGLHQLYEFTTACKTKRCSVPALNPCTKFHAVVVTFEPLYLVNSIPFRQLVSDPFGDDLKKFPCLILSASQLEWLQPHAQAGVSVASLITRLRNKTFGVVIEEVYQQTKLTYKDNFLQQKDKELYSRLGIRNEDLRAVVGH